MDYYRQDITSVLKNTNSSLNGLEIEQVQKNRQLFGQNVISEKPAKSLVKRLIETLFEPMMIILLVAMIITLGVNICKQIRGFEPDYYECLGIFIAITISVSLTIIMEGKSQNAFKMLKKLSQQGYVKVIRNGKESIIDKKDLVVGDIVIIEAGNKIPTDGRIIECENFLTDESTLTGESQAVKKSSKTIDQTKPLAERYNFVFSGTFCQQGWCKYIVTAVGDNAQIGLIAEKVSGEKTISAPLNQKLTRLGKMVTIFGVVSALFVFSLSLTRLILTNSISFDSVQDIFIEAIVLIVAAVPEGLPTTVAISLTLNVLRLAKSNALIKKLIATETVGCVSVICSDKTGTLTKNQMVVSEFVIGEKPVAPDKLTNNKIIYNIAINSTASLDEKSNFSLGSQTEICLLKAVKKCGADYAKIRKSGAISLLTPFSSQIKYMETEHIITNKRTFYLKGAPEVILKKCLLSKSQIEQILNQIKDYQSRGARVIAFASGEQGTYQFDGYAVIEDGLRDDVKTSILTCQKAGIKVKMLTGDNISTATNIAKQAGLSANPNQVVTADYIESLTDAELEKVISNITVIARSTPNTKLRVVSALQKIGEVVAVTGDGVNDAPAIKHADIGIAMGDGSEITKQASDVVLLDNSFSTILKAITFGRNVYSNFQRFISFQLTVNLASMCIIIASLILGLPSPFSSTCLLWLNIIMDGPLALSLGLEMRKIKYLSSKPVKRTDDILSTKLLLRIGIHAAFMCLVVILQRFYNFLNVAEEEQVTVMITMFVFFQIFNALNCREVGSQSALKDIFSNKLLIIMIFTTFAIHILIITFAPAFFGTVRLSAINILKITLTSMSILAFSEFYKLLYRIIKPRIKKAKPKTQKAKSKQKAYAN